MQLFNTKYNPCPRYPEGTTWEVGFRSPYASLVWNMTSFQNALDYLRDQFRFEASKTETRDELNRLFHEFRGHINGPGGTIGWDVLKPLVTQPERRANMRRSNSTTVGSSRFDIPKSSNNVDVSGSMTLERFRGKYGYDAVTMRLVLASLIDKAETLDFLQKKIHPDDNGVCREARQMLEDLRQVLLPPPR